MLKEDNKGSYNPNRNKNHRQNRFRDKQLRVQRSEVHSFTEIAIRDQANSPPSSSMARLQRAILDSLFLCGIWTSLRCKRSLLSPEPVFVCVLVSVRCCMNPLLSSFKHLDLSKVCSCACAWNGRRVARLLTIPRVALLGLSPDVPPPQPLQLKFANYSPLASPAMAGDRDRKTCGGSSGSRSERTSIASLMRPPPDRRNGSYTFRTSCCAPFSSGRSRSLTWLRSAF